MAATERAARTDDEAILHRLGYAQVLYREMGGFSNFAISFTIISILAGCLTSYYLAFNNGGPVAITWGWLLVGAFCVLVAMAMGEIASAMPTAGALYFWASKLGGPAWGWFTGWFNLIGEIAVTAAIQYGSAIFTTALLNLWFPGLGNETGTIFVVFTFIAALQLALNLLNINVLALLNTVSAWWHMVGVAIVVAVLAFVPDNHQSAAFVFGETINNSGFSDSAFWFVFGLGLLMSQYTITGYDASAHMSEETRGASRTAALGMIMAVVASVVFGFVLLVAVTFAVPDVQGVLDAGGDAVIYIWTTALGETWTVFLLLIAVVAQLFCGTASVTASSRMMFAFSRDRAVPFSHVWRKVAANRAPVNAVIAISVLSWALMLPTLVNGVLGYAVGTSIAVIGLYIAFGLPIILRIKAGEAFEPGAWTLGKHYKWVSTIAVVWIGLVCILFLMPLSPAGVPFSADFDWEALNYAPITVFGALVLFGGWYLLSARNWFTGPVPDAGSEAELLTIEDQLEAEAAATSGGSASTGGATAAAAGGTAAAAGAVAVAEKDTASGTGSGTEADAEKDTAKDTEKDTAQSGGDGTDEDTAKETSEVAGDADGNAAAEPASSDATPTAAVPTAAAGGTESAGATDGDTATAAAATAPAADEVDEKAADSPAADAEAAETEAAETEAADDEAADDEAAGSAAAHATADDATAGSPATESAAGTTDTATTADATAGATVTADTTPAAEDAAPSATPESAGTVEAPGAATEPTAEAATEPSATAEPAREDDGADAAATGASTAPATPATPAAATPAAATPAAATTEPVTADPVTTEAPAPGDPDLRARLKDELKAELKAELRAELLEELRREATTNGSAPATTGTDAGTPA